MNIDVRAEIVAILEVYVGSCCHCLALCCYVVSVTEGRSSPQAVGKRRSSKPSCEGCSAVVRGGRTGRKRIVRDGRWKRS